MKEIYAETIALTERVHRRYLSIVKIELERLGIRDINAAQAIILYNIDEDTPVITELQARGYYLGSNVSYNVKKLVEHGYLAQERCTHDRRAMRVACTEQGLNVSRRLDALFNVHTERLDGHGANRDWVTNAHEALQWLESFLATERVVSSSGLRSGL
jgi:DNA-binding MarR family transcriptional regulator